MKAYALLRRGREGSIVRLKLRDVELPIIARVVRGAESWSSTTARVRRIGANASELVRLSLVEHAVPAVYGDVRSALDEATRPPTLPTDGAEQGAASTRGRPAIARPEPTQAPQRGTEMDPGSSSPPYENRAIAGSAAREKASRGEALPGKGGPA